MEDLDDLDDFYKRVQLYLMRKEDEIGQLRFLTSRTTADNIEDIGDIIRDLTEIYESSKIPIKEETSMRDSRCIAGFMFLILNTSLDCQEYLGEDNMKGHLVDMCPSLSSYLLIQIFWALNYDQLIAESIQHFPLDLTLEILPTLRRCVKQLDFHRRLEFLSKCVENLYRKIILVHKNGTQSLQFDKNLELLTVNFQEFLGLLEDTKISGPAAEPKSDGSNSEDSYSVGHNSDPNYGNPRGLGRNSDPNDEDRLFLGPMVDPNFLGPIAADRNYDDPHFLGHIADQNFDDPHFLGHIADPNFEDPHFLGPIAAGQNFDDPHFLGPIAAGQNFDDPHFLGHIAGPNFQDRHFLGPIADRNFQDPNNLGPIADQNFEEPNNLGPIADPNLEDPNNLGPIADPNNLGPTAEPNVVEEPNNSGPTEEENVELEKSTRMGEMLKKILGLTRNCLKASIDGVEVSPDMDTMYKITFGREKLSKSEDDVKAHLRMLDQLLAHLTLKKLKEIDFSTYLDWASIEGPDYGMTMQQSIGKDCYDLMIFINKSFEYLDRFGHLTECLQQLATKPRDKSELEKLNIGDLRRELEGSEKSANPEKSVKSVNSEKSEKSVNVEKSANPEKSVKSVNPEKSEKSVNAEKSANPEKSVNPEEIGDKSENSEKSENLEKSENPEIGEKSENSENPEIGEKSENSENPEIGEKSENSENPEIGEKSENSENPEIGEKSENSENPEIGEKSENSENPEIGEKSENSEKSVNPEEIGEKSENPEKSENSEEIGEKSENPKIGEKSENPEIGEKSENSEKSVNPAEIGEKSENLEIGEKSENLEKSVIGQKSINLSEICIKSLLTDKSVNPEVLKKLLKPSEIGKKVINPEIRKKSGNSKIREKPVINPDEMDKKSIVKELLKRYREWDFETFDLIARNESLITDKSDLSTLLEYLTLTMMKNSKEEPKKFVYLTTVRIFMRFSVADLYEITLNYIIKHDGRDILASGDTEMAFRNFMAHNQNFRSPKNLRILLFFILKNPRKIFANIVRIFCGDSEFSSFAITPQDFSLLAPFMKIRDTEKSLIIFTSIYDVSNYSLDTKKYVDFIGLCLENRVFTFDQYVNELSIPFLHYSGPKNLQCVLNCLRRFSSLCTSEIKILDFLEALKIRLSIVRNELDVSKYEINEILGLIPRLIVIYLRFMNYNSEEVRFEVERRIELSISPIDRVYFKKILNNKIFVVIDISDVIINYEKKCFFSLNPVQLRPRWRHYTPKLDNYYDDFLRHVFLTSTIDEYVKFALQSTILYWNDFLNCDDDYLGFDKVANITFQAAILCLEYPRTFPAGNFVCLIKGFSRFLEKIASLEEIKHHERIYLSIINNLRTLDEAINYTIFEPCYKSFIAEINNHEDTNLILIEKFAKSAVCFADKCREIPIREVSFDGEHSEEAMKNYIAYEFVDYCVKKDFKDDKGYQSICRVYKLI